MEESVSALVSGSFAGAVSTLAGAPFDTVKVRLQTNSRRFHSFSQCLYRTIREESVISLYKGATPAMASAVLENSVVFFANSMIKRTWIWAKGPTEEGKDASMSDLSLQELAVIGGLAGVFSATAICPTETIKCSLQAHLALRTDKDVGKLGPLTCAKQLLETEGLKGLFRGLPAQYARDIPFNFVFFGSYETLCRGICVWRGKASKNDLNPLDIIMAGGFAGIAGWTVTIPMDTVKSRAQTTGRSSRDVVYQILKEHGFRGFFKGWSAAVMRAFPTNGALFAAYEVAERFLQSL